MLIEVCRECERQDPEMYDGYTVCCNKLTKWIDAPAPNGAGGR
jgi:hypothetical protein